MGAVLGISTAAGILAWVGLVIGFAVLLVVASLFYRVVRPALEIRRYALDTLASAEGIARNLKEVPELERTRDLAAAVPGLAESYLRRRGDGLP